MMMERIQQFLQDATPREKTLLTLFLIVLALSAAFTISGYVQRNTTVTPQEGGAYTEAAVGQPRHINPILAPANDTDQDITNLVFSPLFRLSNTFELVPDLATGFTASEDGLAYTVQLRSDISWHDGVPFTADDVVFTIRSIQTPDYGSPLASSFQGVQLEKIDDHTVIFRLNQPYAPFAKNLAIGISPQHVWESIAPKNAPLAEQMLRPVGTGPFQFQELTSRRKTGEITSLTLTRNEKYHGARPLLDEFTFQFYPTNDEAVRGFVSGAVDGVGFLPLERKDEVASRAALTIHRLLLPQYFALFFNDIKNDVLGDAGVRAALALATDRDRIVEEAMQGEATPLHLPIPPQLFSLGEDLPGATFDPEIARQNLDEAGWKDENNDGVREKDGKRLALTITTTDWPEFVRTAEIIQEGWKTLGVDVTIESFGPGAIQQTIVGPREYQVLLYGEILQSDPDPYPLWHSTQTRSPGLNLSLFKDAQTDKILEEGRKTIDAGKRKELYKEFLERFFDLNPAIILYQPQYLYATHRSVRGQTMTDVNLPAGRFADVEKWHVKVNRVWK